MMVTTWKPPGGWLEVREALTMGPTTQEDRITPHTRPPDHDVLAHHAFLKNEIPVAGVAIKPEPAASALTRGHPWSTSTAKPRSSTTSAWRTNATRPTLSSVS